ncbi:MAG: hypothetical protein ACSHXF_02760 [Aquaticitalea sp.]
MKFIATCVICAILFISCKNDTSKTETTTDEITTGSDALKNENKNVFSVLLNVQVPKDDALEVFYLENESDTYKASHMIQKKITGANEFQQVSFELPKDVYPYNVRLDFGFNEDQDPIKISECTLSYNNNSFVITGKKLKNYFNFNGGIEMQSDSLTFKLKPFDLNGKQVHDPYIVGNKNLESALMTKI